MPRSAGMAAPSAPLVQALRMLVALGWSHAEPEQVRQWRGSRRELLLKPRLVEVLQTRRFEYKGRRYALSPAGIEQVVRELSAVNLADGLLPANERVYGKLLLGVTVTEFMPDGKRHQPTIALVDWSDPAANRWDVAEQVELPSHRGEGMRRLGLVCYVNGIPLALIETGAGALARHLQRQHHDELPSAYAHAQLLLALDDAGARYGTTGTPEPTWARWREEEFSDEQIARWLQVVPPPTEAQRLVAAVLRPARLLELLRHFVLFDRRHGKVVARSHQYFAVRALLQRIRQRRPDGSREGGVVWHTAGSGKSCTMVFLTKALLQHDALKACRVVVVTDRLDLEDQLARNFVHGGAFGATAAARKEGERARVASGKELARRIGQGSERVVFALIHKFATASRLPECYNPSADLVVLVDESHRSHGGELHERMRRSLPRAACIAFTGTPLLRSEKAAQRFGPVLHTYTMPRAVDDGTVVPLLYEERALELHVDDAAADRWFEQVTSGVAPERRAELLRRYSSRHAACGAAQRIGLIAWDIAAHFDRHIRPLGLKGQVATASKLDAIRYQRCLDATGLVRTAVVISPPQAREGQDGGDTAELDEVRAWWQADVGKDAAAYERRVLDGFAGDDEPDLLIVVDRLLTGFDAPRNAVLYIDKPLKGHNLLQAIARVNRPHEAKRYGLLVDYRGILKELDTTLQAYQDLEAHGPHGYDPADLEGLYRPVRRQASPAQGRVPPAATDTAGDDGAERSLRAWLDTGVAALGVRESPAVYAVHRLGRPAGPPAHWDDHRTRAEAALLQARLEHAIRVGLPRQPRKDRAFGERLRQALHEAQAAFEHPRFQYALLQELEQELARGEASGVQDDEAAGGHTSLQMLREALGEAGCRRLGTGRLEEEARYIDAVVCSACEESFLNPENRDAAIRRALLPRWFELVGLDDARRVIEHAIRRARTGARRQE